MANRTVIIATSAARTATGNTGVLNVPSPGDYRGVVFSLDISAASGTTPTLDITIDRADSASGKFIALPSAAFAQQTTTATLDLVVYPGVAETANRSVSDVIGETYRVVWTIGGTTPSFTFTIGAVFIL